MGRSYKVEVLVPPSGGKVYEKASGTIRADRAGLQTWTAAIRELALRVPAGFQAKAGVGPEPYTGTGLPREIVHETTGIELVFIPAGTFMMGGDQSAAEVVRHGGGKAEWYSGEHPQRRVTISRPFYMGKFEVTQSQWQRVMGSNPSRFQRSDRLPVERVSWDDCQAFLRRAGGGLRLPTEAEWEYTCRAGTTTPFHTGATISTDEANYDGKHIYGAGRNGVFRGLTVDVGSFSPNAWGLYDMHGNVFEWCQDWYGAYPPDAAMDPTERTSGMILILRGGSWYDNPRDCRSAFRAKGSPGDRSSDRGFRAALDLK